MRATRSWNSCVTLIPNSLLIPEHGRVNGLGRLAFAELHVHVAGQAWIETTHSAHDVDPLKFVRAVLLENGSVLHRVFIRSRSAVAVARVGVPGSGRVGMVVRDLAFANDDVMR